MDTKIKVSEYISKRLSDYGVKFIYGMMGGGSAGLNDSFISNEKLEYICFHHEQGAANAAIAESKIKNDISVVNPTTGCGGANCITSLISAYQDSIPVLFISGNIALNKTSTYINSTKKIKIRKNGLQEHDIISHVKNATKYCKFITNPEEIIHELDKALEICMQGRKGPCWIDIPSDIQNSFIDSSLCRNFSIKKENSSVSKIKVKKILDALEKSNKPLVLAGNGICLSNSENEFLEFVEKYKIPFVSTFAGKNISHYGHPLYVGTIGIKGSRSGNFALQNSELLLILGCSLDGTHIGYNENLFAPKSYKIFVNIDNNDFLKNNFKIDSFLKCDIKDFFNHV